MHEVTVARVPCLAGTEQIEEWWGMKSGEAVNVDVDVDVGEEDECCLEGSFPSQRVIKTCMHRQCQCSSYNLVLRE